MAFLNFVGWVIITFLFIVGILIIVSAIQKFIWLIGG